MLKTFSLDKNTVKKGAWSEEEDGRLRDYIQRYGHWNWTLLPKFAGLSRSGKSCRLRWMNYLRPHIKHGNFTKEEDDIIFSLHEKIGNKWSAMAATLPGRSDNEVKNRWNSHLKKRVQEDQTHVNENEQDETIKLDQAPLCSSGRTELPSWWLSGSDYANSSDDTPRTYNFEVSGDFWTEAFLPDITSSIESTSPLSLVDLVSQASCDDMMMSDDASWSTLGSYFGYNVNEFIN